MAEIVTFSSRRGSFHFGVMLFGLGNAPAAFERFSEVVLGDLPFLLTYVDDKLVRLSSGEEHVKHQGIVLDRLGEAEVKVKLKKCTFRQTKVSLLGRLVSGGAI